MTRFRTVLVAAAALGLPALVLAQMAGRAPDPKWLKWNPTTRTTTFELIAGLTGTGAKSPFNFNGYTEGELTLAVPESTTVVMNFVNEDGTPHSALVIDDKGPIPNMAEHPAIQRAYTVKALEGLGYYAKDVVRFKAVPAGDYKLFCGVPGHGLSGMWIRLKVIPGLAAPEMQETPKPAP